MARFVLLLPLLGVAAADVACPDGVCPSDADEHSALLQHRATQAVNISAQAGRACGTAWPLPDTTPHCGASPAGTCRGVRGDTMMCFRDTSGCTSSGGGMGCKAAGDVCPGMEQCRFCGTGGGAPDCPPAVACCLANTASCYACQAGMSEADLCKSYPDTAGCPSAPTPTPAPDSTTAAPTRPPPTRCCLAMTATCLACQAGVSVEEFCTAGPGNAQVAGCTSTGPYCSSPGSVAKGYFCEYKYDWNSASWDWYGCCRPYTWCTSAAPDGSQSVCMDYPVAAPMLAQVKIETTDCNVGGVAGKAVCPGSGNYCEGDQCCPGTEASNGSTFPCPSASDSYKGCVSHTKLATCGTTTTTTTVSAVTLPALAQVMTIPIVTCESNGNVACPGSGNMCMGDQCCPGVPASGGGTFPCPSASDSYKSCVNNTKLATCGTVTTTTTALAA